MSNRKVYVFRAYVKENKKPNPIAIVWNDRRLFFGKAYYFKIIQGSYESKPLNGWFEIINTDDFDPRQEFKIVVVGKKGKDFSLSTDSFVIQKKGFLGIGWKNLETKVFLDDVKFVKDEKDIIKEIKQEESLVVDTAIDFYRGLLRLGLLAAGGVLIWRRVKR